MAIGDVFTLWSKRIGLFAHSNTLRTNSVAVTLVGGTGTEVTSLGISQTTLGTTNAVYSAPNPQTPTAYRTAIVAADVVAVPGTVTCTKINGVGALTAGVYYVKVVAANAHGRTTAKAGDTTVTTETTNLCIKAAFAAVTGATHYDIYCSTAADPLFVGRITEAQRASGIIINAVNTTTAGGAVDSVYIYPIGTGLAAGTTAAVSNAWVIPASPVVCTGYTYVDFLVSCTRTGDLVAPALTVAPFLYDSRDATYYQGAAYTHVFGGTAGLYNGMKFSLRVDVRGCAAAALLVQAIAGTGLAVTVDAMLS